MKLNVSVSHETYLYFYAPSQKKKWIVSLRKVFELQEIAKPYKSWRTVYPEKIKV